MFLPEPPPPPWEAAPGPGADARTRLRGAHGAERLGTAASKLGPRQLAATLDGEGPEGRAAWQVHLRLLGRPRGLSFS